jgi:hypothetical protein
VSLISSFGFSVMLLCLPILSNWPKDSRHLDGRKSLERFGERLATRLLEGLQQRSLESLTWKLRDCRKSQLLPRRLARRSGTGTGFDRSAKGDCQFTILNSASYFPHSKLSIDGSDWRFWIWWFGIVGKAGKKRSKKKGNHSRVCRGLTWQPFSTDIHSFWAVASLGELRAAQAWKSFVSRTTPFLFTCSPEQNRWYKSFKNSSGLPKQSRRSQ